MNVNKVLTKNYDKKDTWSIRKNEPKRTQNEPKFKKAKMNVNKVLTRDYENISNWAICENEPNLSRRSLWRRRKQIPFSSQYNAM